MEKRKFNLAQTASELAIFGAVLVFVLGLIIRYAVNFNYAQNQSLEAMRLAMRQSFLTSTSGTNGEGDASRNTASVLFIEDRIDPGLSANDTASLLQGTRTPYAVSGTGSFSKDFFVGTDYGHNENLPTMDLFINGKHFTFLMAGFKSVDIDVNHRGSLPDYLQSNIEDHCIPDEPATDYPCMILYTRIVNSDPKFCAPACPGTYSQRGSCFAEEMDKRFDLNRDGTPDDIQCETKQNFAWQWYPIKATIAGIDIKEGRGTSVDVDGDLKEEQIREMYDENTIRYDSEGNDGGSWYEDVADWLSGGASATQARIATVGVIDFQAGDLDFTRNTWDAACGDPLVLTCPSNGCLPCHSCRGTPLPPQCQYRCPECPARPGLLEKSELSTSTPTEGLLRIEEGKLYSGVPGNKQFVRNATSRDRVDYITRIMQLSNDTGRFCDPNRPGIGIPPVETCATVSDNCYQGGKEGTTCFDNRPGELKLYIRSRIGDKRGRKWITDVSRDTMPIR